MKAVLKVKLCIVIACAVSTVLAYQRAAADAPPPDAGLLPRLSNATALALERLGDTTVEPASRPAAATPLSAWFTSPLFPAAPLSQTALGTNFQGLGYLNTEYYYPPNGGVAASPGFVMQVVNVHYAVYNRYGVMYATDSLVNFFQPVLSTLGAYNVISDPRVVYDAVRGRWLVSLLVINDQTDGNGWVLLAVSPGSDPTVSPALWHQSVVITTRDSGTARSFGDFDTLGFDSRNVYIGTNQFTFARNADGTRTFKGNDLWVLNREDAYGAPGTTVDLQRFANVSCLSSAQPVGGDEDPPQGYFVSWSRCSATQFIAQPIAGTAPLASLGTQIVLNTFNVGQPPLARQLNGPNTVDTLDGRVMNAVYRNGTLWTAHTVSQAGGGDGSAVIHWLQIDPVAKTVLQQGIYSSTATDYYYPMLAVDSRNNALLVFNRSSAAEYIGAWYAARLSSDPPGTFGAPSLLKSGVDQYYRYYDATDTRNRWGDYNGVALDPNGHTVWMEAAWADARVPVEPNGSYGNWTTWIGSTDLPYPLLSPTVTLASALNPSVYGQAVTLTARVTSTAGGGAVPTGTLVFQIDSAAVTRTLDATGAAWYVTSTLGAGAHTVTAAYLGNRVYSSTLSVPLTQTVTRAGTITAMGAWPQPSSYGQAVTITLRVISGNSGLTPTGSITLSIDAWNAALPLDASGVASYVTSTLSAGTHALTAAYSGDANYTGSSAMLVQTVNPAATTITLTAAPATATVFGQAVTFTARIASSAAGLTPTGVLTLSVDAVAVPLALDASGIVVYTPPTLSAGAHAISAVYGGAPDYAASSAALTQTVQRAPVEIALSGSPAPSTYPQAVTFTAQVGSGIAGYTPTGQLTFSIGASAAVQALDASGAASYITSALSGGAHLITATYGGDAYFAGAGAVYTQTVNRVNTLVGTGAYPNPVPFGQPMTVTLRIFSFGQGITPTGIVTLSIDSWSTALALDATAIATWVTTTMSSGTHDMTAQYPGDLNFNPSSAFLYLTVGRTNSFSSLSAAPNPSTYGRTVTLTALVTSSVTGFTPTGVVTFSVGGTGVPLALDAAGSAAYATSTLSIAAHPITVTYGGDASYFGSAATLTQTVNRALSYPSIVPAPSPSTLRQPVTFTLQLTSAVVGITPTGNVTLSIDAAQVDLPLDAGGAAAYTTSTLSIAAHAITLTYGGDANFSGSTAALTHIVNRAPSAMNLAAASNPAPFAQAVTFTMQVTSSLSGLTSTGAVTLSIGSAAIPLALNANGAATYMTSTLNGGAHAITATYGGDASYTGSAATLTQVISRAATTVALTDAPAGVSALGQAVTFTMRVSSSVGGYTPTGSVTLTVDGAPVVLVLNAAGGASYATASLRGGDHTITATYGGDIDFDLSAAAITHMVNPAATTIAAASLLNPSSYGQTVTFTARVTPGVAGFTPTGILTVDFGTAAHALLLDASGAATLTTSTLTAGAHPITVTYGGDASFTGSATVLAQSVNRAATVAALQAQPPVSTTYGQAVTFTARIASGNPGVTPTDIVTLSIDAANLTLALDGSGSASYTTATLGVGAHAVTVTYGGDANFLGSGATLPYTVYRAPAYTAIASSANPSTIRQPLTFTLQVTSSVAGITPTGMVTLSIDATQAVLPLDAEGGALYTTTALNAGAHVITLTYSGDALFNGAAAAITQTVDRATTTVALVSAPNPAVLGQAVTFTAQVTSGAAGLTPTGALTLDFGGGAVVLSLDAAGSASYVTSTLSGGAHTMTATCDGDANFIGSGTTLTQTVLKASSSATLTAAPNPSVYGQPVTVTATVTSSVAGFTPSGVITLTIDAAPLVLALDATGSASYVTATLGGGTHALAALYNGDTNFSGAGAALTQTIARAAPGIALAASPSPATLGRAVTFTVQLTPAGAGIAPGGAVTLNLGAASAVFTPDATGSASYMTSTLNLGAHAISAAYGGDMNYLSAGAAITLAVQLPAYSLSLYSGGSGHGTITATPPGPTFTQGTPITLTALPAADSSFIVWSGALSGTQNPVILTLNGDAAVTATFALNAVIGMVGNSAATTITVAPVEVGLGDAVTATINLSGSAANRLLAPTVPQGVDSLTLDVTATLDSRLSCLGVDPPGLCDDASHTARWSGVTVTLEGPIVALTASAALSHVGPLSGPLPAPLLISYTAVDTAGSGMFEQVSAPVAVRPPRAYVPIVIR